MKYSRALLTIIFSTFLFVSLAIGVQAQSLGAPELEKTDIAWQLSWEEYGEAHHYSVVVEAPNYYQSYDVTRGYTNLTLPENLSVIEVSVMAYTIYGELLAEYQTAEFEISDYLQAETESTPEVPEFQPNLPSEPEIDPDFQPILGASTDNVADEKPVVPNGYSERTSMVGIVALVFGGIAVGIFLYNKRSKSKDFTSY